MGWVASFTGWAGPARNVLSIQCFSLVREGYKFAGAAKLRPVVGVVTASLHARDFFLSWLSGMGLWPPFQPRAAKRFGLRCSNGNFWSTDQKGMAEAQDRYPTPRRIQTARGLHILERLHIGSLHIWTRNQAFKPKRSRRRI